MTDELRVAVVVPGEDESWFELRAVPGVAVEEVRYTPTVAKLTDVSLLGIYLAVHVELGRRADARRRGPDPATRIGR